MSTCPKPESLALWVDEGREAGISHEHLATCVACDALVRALEADRELLRRRFEFSEAQYAAVRGRVLKRVSDRKSRVLYGLAAAIAAILVLALFMPRIQRPEPQRITAKVQKNSEPSAVQTASVGKTNFKRPRARKTHVEKPSSAELIAALDKLYEDPSQQGIGAPGQVVISMATADPDVTIILLGESTGDEE